MSLYGLKIIGQRVWGFEHSLIDDLLFILNGLIDGLGVRTHIYLIYNYCYD